MSADGDNEMMRRLLRRGFTAHRIPDNKGGLGVLYFAHDLPAARMHEGVLVWPNGQAHAYRSTDVVNERNLLSPPDPSTWAYWDIGEVGQITDVIHSLLSQPPGVTRHGSVPPVWMPPKDGRP